MLQKKAVMTDRNIIPQQDTISVSSHCILAVYEVSSPHAETRDSLDFIVHDCLLALLSLRKPPQPANMLDSLCGLLES